MRTPRALTLHNMVDKGPLLTSAIIFYLSIGAAIFQVLEEPNWKLAVNQYRSQKDKILEAYPCLTKTDLDRILEVSWCCKLVASWVFFFPPCVGVMMFRLELRSCLLKGLLPRNLSANKRVVTACASTNFHACFGPKFGTFYSVPQT